MTVVHPFEGDPDHAQLTVAVGDSVQQSDCTEDGAWAWVLSDSGNEGYVPSSYLEKA